MVENKTKSKTNEAFVVFANTDEVELALRDMDGKKIRKTFIKAFRSSEEQFSNYCDTTILPNPMPLLDNSITG